MSTAEGVEEFLVGPTIGICPFCSTPRAVLFASSLPAACLAPCLSVRQFASALLLILGTWSKFWPFRFAQAATSDRLNSPLRSVMRERARQREMGNARTDRSGRQRRALQGGDFILESDAPEVQQSKRFHIMYGLFQSVETTNGGLLNEANIVKMKELEDKIVKHAEFPNFCKFKSLHVDANGDKFYGRRTAANGTTTWCQPSQPDTACKATCQPPMTITNYFYPRATLTASVLKDSALFTFLMALTGSPRAANVPLTQMRNSPVFNVKARGTTAGAALMQLARYKKIVSDLSATTGKGVDASDAYDVVICKAKTASAACKATVGCAWTSAACGPNAAAILASKFARVIATSDGTGPKVDIPVMANLLGQFYQNDGMKPYLDFFFDKDFSASIGTTPTNIWTRNFFSFGAPLAGYASKGDNRAAQNTAFVDWFQTNFRDEFEAQVDQDAGINMYYLNSAAMQDEIITILTHDALMALFSVFVVMLWMWFQTGYSVLIATMGMIEICMSLPMAVFFYRVVFGFMYFDFLNMLVLYIILAIGADGPSTLRCPRSKLTRGEQRTRLLARLAHQSSRRYTFAHAVLHLLPLSWNSCAFCHLASFLCCPYTIRADVIRCIHLGGCLQAKRIPRPHHIERP